MNDSNEFKRDSYRNTRNSLKHTGSHIVNNNQENQYDNIREGILADSGQSTKRKPIVGIRPDQIDPRSSMRKSSVKDHRYNSDKDNDEEINHNPVKREYQQDILTKQAIEEIKDNIKSFKIDISRYVQELRDEQEKIELGDIKYGIKDLSEKVLGDLRITRSQNDKDFDEIKEKFIDFKSQALASIDDAVKQNKQQITEISQEINDFKAVINQKFKMINDKQEIYIAIVKKILENSHDQYIRDCVQQLLVDDKDTFEANRERFEKENEERRKKEEKEYDEKEAKNRARRQKEEEEEMRIEAQEEEELKYLLVELKRREDDLIRQKALEYGEVEDQIKGDKIYQRQKESEADEEKANEEDENYLKVELQKSKSPEQIQNEAHNEQEQSLNHFTRLYLNGHNHLKAYIKSTEKKSIYYLLIQDSFDIRKYVKDKDRYRKQPENYPEITEMLKHITTILDMLFDSLILSLDDSNNYDAPQRNDEPKLKAPSKSYLKFILGKKQCLPYKFFSLFEMSRLTFKDGYLISPTREQKEMILLFYLIIKILIKHYFIQYDFLEISEKIKLNDLSRNNITVIASIIFQSIIAKYQGLPIINKISNIKEEHMKQGEENDDLKNLLNIGLKGLEGSYPDGDVNGMDFISKNLYTSQQMAIYWVATEMNNNPIGLKIAEFANRLTALIDNYKD